MKRERGEQKGARKNDISFRRGHADAPNVIEKIYRKVTSRDQKQP